LQRIAVLNRVREVRSRVAVAQVLDRRVAVGIQQHGELAVSALDVLPNRIAVGVQELIVLNRVGRLTVVVSLVKNAALVVGHE
jgi:hypothetical protein